MFWNQASKWSKESFRLHMVNSIYRSELRVTNLLRKAFGSIFKRLKAILKRGTHFQLYCCEVAGEWKKPIFMHAISKMSISNWRFWQSVAISWKNLQFIVKILKVSGWDFISVMPALYFFDCWLRGQAMGSCFEFCEICTHASIFVSRAVKKKSKGISMPDLVSVYRIYWPS